MTFEIEAKYAVRSHGPIRAQLQKLEAERIGAVLETNHIFDRPDRSLFATDCGLRVREIRVLDGAEQPATLTFKGARTGAALKTRQEVETPIGDAVAACRLLRALGFVETVTFEKRRESWRFGASRVELDELPHLGLFVEIEAAEEATVHQARDTLGLGDSDFIRESYIALLIGHCQQHNLPAQRITFG